VKFIPARDLRTSPAQVWKDLPEEREIVITNNGNPIALLTPISDATLEDTLATVRRALLELLKTAGEYLVAEPHPAAFKDDDDRAFSEIAVSGGADCLDIGDRSHYPEDKKVRRPAEFPQLYLRKRGKDRGTGGLTSR